jgi:hypothetical protein
MIAKYIGDSADYAKDQPFALSVQKMTGRIYKPGKDANGWIDKEGTQDNRFMVWGSGISSVPYKVYASADEVVKDWLPVNWNDVQANALLSHMTSKDAQILKNAKA